MTFAFALSMSSPQPSHHSSVSIRTRTRLARWDSGVPPLLRPLLRAYLLGYAFSVGPRLLALVLHHALKLARRRQKAAGGPAENKPEPQLLESLSKTVQAGFEWQRFPTFCAALVGGSTLLEVWFVRTRTWIITHRLLANQLLLARSSQSHCSHLGQQIRYNQNQVS